MFCRVRLHDEDHGEERCVQLRCGGSGGANGEATDRPHDPGRAPCGGLGAAEERERGGARHRPQRPARLGGAGDAAGARGGTPVRERRAGRATDDEGRGRDAQRDPA